MKKKTSEPRNIKAELEALESATLALETSIASYAEAENLLDIRLGELEAMEPGIDVAIDEIEREGQEDLAADAIEFAGVLDGLEREQGALEAEDSREGAEDAQ